jgi:hypothetical protein
MPDRAFSRAETLCPTHGAAGPLDPLPEKLSRLLPVVSWITGRALGLVLWWRIPSRDRIPSRGLGRQVRGFGISGLSLSVPMGCRRLARADRVGLHRDHCCA